jgi:hypothetical protein
MTSPFKKEDHTRYSLDDVDILILGKSKSGKTVLAQALGKMKGKPTSNVMTEKGLTEEAYSVKVKSWQKLLDLLRILKAPSTLATVKETHGRLSLDLISDLDSMCMQYIADKHSVDHVAEIGANGKGYWLCELEFSRVMDEFSALGIPMCYICHLKESIVTDAKGANSIDKTPNLNRFAGKWIGAKCDVIMVVAVTKKGEPKLEVMPAFGNVAGSRVKEIVGVYDLDHDDMTNTLKEINSKFKTKKETK